MRRTTAAILGLVLLSTAFTGCIGSQEDRDEKRPLNETLRGMIDNATRDPPRSDDDGDTTTPPGSSTIHRLTFGGAVVSEQVWRNGSFSRSDVCQPTATDCQGLARKRVPLSEYVPVGMPVRVEARLTYETVWGPPLVLGSIDLSLNVSGEVYDVVSSNTPGEATLEGVAVADASNQVFLDASYSGQEPSRNVSYSLEISVEGSPFRLPANVPVQVHLASEGSNLTVSPREDKVVRAWSAQGDYLGDFELEEGQVRLPLEGGRSYVILVADPPSFVSLFATNTSAAPPTLVPLEETRTFGSPHRLGPQGSTEWTFEVDTVPLRAGLYVDATGPTARSGLRGSVSQDGEPVFTFQTQGTTVKSYGGMSTWVSSSDLSNVTAGTWAGQVQASASTVAEVGEILVDWGEPVLQR